MRRILLYGLDDEVANKTRELLEPRNITTNIIGDDVLDQTLADVFEAEDDFDGRHQEFDVDFMIFDGIPVEEMVKLLVYLSNEGVLLPGVKISRTENNSKWIMRKLFAETLSEHRLALKIVQLQQKLLECNNIDLEAVEPKLRSELKKAMVDAYVLIKAQKSYTAEDVDKAYEHLSRCLESVPKLYN